MGIIKILLQKEALVFRNSYLRTVKQILIALALLTAYLVFMGWLTWYFTGRMRPLLADIPPELEMLVITPLFYIILIWLLFLNFTAMLKEARSRFYHSPELSLLVTSPIPANTLFLFRFILGACFSQGALGTLLIIVPALIAMGIIGAAPWYYYLFVLPVLYPLLIISACFAVVLVMLLVKVLSAKRIMQATAALGFLGIPLMVGFLVGFMGHLPQLLEWVMAAELVWDVIFPLNDGATVLSRLVQGEVVLWPLLRLFLASGVILAGSMLAAGRLYYQGYERSQMVEITGKRRVERRATEPISLGRRSNLILTEWKKAVRNYEMAQAAIRPLAILLLLLSLLAAGGAAPPEPSGSLVLLGLIGVIGFLVTGMVAVFFTPAAVQQDRKLLKEQFCVLKSAPFGGGDFILCNWLAPFIPQILLSGIILLLLHIFIGSSILIILLSLVVLALLVGSVGALKLGLDIAGIAGRGETTNLLDRALPHVLPKLYYILALGILALGLAYTEIGFLGFLHHLPQGLMTSISSAAFLGLVGFTSYYSFRLGAKYWEEMEI